jgi:hypothetical protein
MGPIMTPRLIGWHALRLGRSRSFAAAILLVALIVTAMPSRADQGGVSFWLPGQFGSLAAAPQVPGWAIGIINYYTTVSAGGAVAAAKQVTIGRLNPTINLSLNASLAGHADLVFVAPSYTFATPIFGGQLAASMAGAFGGNNAAVSGTLTASAGGVTVFRQGSISDSLTSNSDLYPQVSLRWNAGVHNWMVYGMGDIPVGNYNPSNLANIGIGHGAADAGAGYTYFDPKTGHEFSIVTGFTYNLINPSTNYQNGIDWHADWGASQFLTKQWQIGVVGYFYQQITADTGCAPILCPFESRVIGVGPQVGYLFPIGNMQGYINVKAYWEFAAQNRPDGWNGWLTFALSPTAPTASPPVLTK